MKPGKYKMEAIVLGRVNYSEADLIVHFLTRERGHLSGLAKHGRKSRKRFGNLLLPGAVAELDFQVRRGADLVRLESGELIRSLDEIGADPRRLGLAGLCLEAVGAFCAPMDPAGEVYDLLMWCLDRLNRGDRADEAVFVFQLKLLGLAGFGPGASACVCCGRAVDGDFSGGLSAGDGGAVCRTCRPGGRDVSLGTLKLMILIQNMPPDKIDRVRVGRQAMAEAGPYLLDSIRHHLGRDLKSARYLEQLSRPQDR